MIGEYLPATSSYYYYASDQINSTRLVTDSTGAVVHSAQYDPYGGLYKTWIDTYHPKPGFSGKEREFGSELDYFGARYYGHRQYRFLSVDPVIKKTNTSTNPLMWNLYSYCGNNPINSIDPDGNASVKINIEVQSRSYFSSKLQGHLGHFVPNISNEISKVIVWNNKTTPDGRVEYNLQINSILYMAHSFNIFYLISSPKSVFGHELSHAMDFATKLMSVVQSYENMVNSGVSLKDIGLNSSLNDVILETMRETSRTSKFKRDVQKTEADIPIQDSLSSGMIEFSNPEKANEFIK